MKVFKHHDKLNIVWTFKRKNENVFMHCLFVFVFFLLKPFDEILSKISFFLINYLFSSDCVYLVLIAFYALL